MNAIIIAVVVVVVIVLLGLILIEEQTDESHVDPITSTCCTISS